MPYGLGFSHSEINEKCKKQFGKRNSFKRMSTRLKMLRQSIRRVDKETVIHEEKETNEGEFQLQELNSIVTLNVDQCETRIFGG